MEKTSSSRGSPAREYPDLCYRHVYLERDLYNMVHLFGHWNKVSDKRTVHQLITYGLKYYATAILRAEEARQANAPPPKIRQLPFDTIAAIVDKIKKQQKETHVLPQSE